MSRKIPIDTLDGKVLHQPRARVQRLVDRGTHTWNSAKTRAQEIKAHSSSSDPHRFLSHYSLPIFSYVDYPEFEAHPELAEGALRYPMNLAKDQTSFGNYSWD